MSNTSWSNIHSKITKPKPNIYDDFALFNYYSYFCSNGFSSSFNYSGEKYDIRYGLFYFIFVKNYSLCKYLLFKIFKFPY